jgi:hypothetical protein
MEGDTSVQSPQQVGYVSCITYNLLKPIDTLIQQLETANVSPPNEVQASSKENGLSLAIIALLAIMVESAIGRVRYDLLGEEGCLEAYLKDRGYRALDFFSSWCPCCSLKESLTEIFVFRDAVAHGHLYVDEVSLDETEGMRLHLPRLVGGYGSGKHKQSVDPLTRTTKRLGLHMFPTRIGRSDVLTVLGQAVRILQYLGDHGSRCVSVSGQHVEDGGRWTPLADYPDRLAARWKGTLISG